jgi:glutathione S-transferase
MKLIIGDKNYSSWSLRAWLVAKASGLAFEEVMVLLDTPEFRSETLKYTPAARVPALVDGKIAVWDTIAIAEYLNEKAPAAGLWPDDVAARAVARSVSAEMHAGFGALRNHLPMNIRRPPADRPRPAAVDADIARITEIWRDARQAHGKGGPFLFGRFTIADAFYAPVVTRFITYNVPLGDVEGAYVQAIMNHSAMKEWVSAALLETHIVPHDEVD